MFVANFSNPSLAPLEEEEKVGNSVITRELIGVCAMIEQIVHGSMDHQEPLSLPHTFKSTHDPLSIVRVNLSAPVDWFKDSFS
jgi:hypothetical protein